MRSFKIIICSLFILTLAYSLSAQTKGGRDDLRDFVQSFYDWYVPRCLKYGPNPACKLALGHKSSVFSPQLARMLTADLAALAKSPPGGQIVSLDYDPFLFAQDPCARYKVGTAIQEGERYMVEIYGICDGKKSGKPHVVAELSRKRDRWLFVNFHYPQGSDLLTELKVLAEERKKHSNQ